MGAVVEVSSQTFDEAVLERSLDAPVILDFFAQWCGPCQMLKPLLAQLSDEYDFVLATVDIDQNPELARIYRVEGVPDVKVVAQGQVYNGFVGMLPEPQLRELLGKLGLRSDLERGLEAIAAAQAQGDTATVAAQYATLLARYGDRPSLCLDAAQFYLSQGELDTATALLAQIDPLQRPEGDRAQALRAVLDWHHTLAVGVEGAETPAGQCYAQGITAAIAGDYDTAIAHLLDLVKRDRAYGKDAARKALLTLFAILGDDHPLTRDGRKRLMQTLY